MANSSLTVIVGGGFVGLFTALHLRQQRYPNSVILINDQERFVFKPLLYEYLTGEMHSEQVLPRYNSLLQNSDIQFVRDRVTHIDLAQRSLETATGLHYDYQYLVLAVGSAQGYFGTAGAQEHAFPFRTQQDIDALEQHLRQCLQQASQTDDPAERQKLLTVAVVGAGPSGVEAAATLADLLPQWYDALGGNIRDLRLVLVNHGEEILKDDINSHLHDAAQTALQQRAMPVELLLGVSVRSVSSDQLSYQAEQADSCQALVTATTIWTAGTATNPLITNLPLADEQRDRHGLPIVSPTLQLPDFPEVFAAGDCAVVQAQSLPPVAQVAYQQGKGIAHNLIALAQGESPQPVKVNLRGTLMKLGIRNGVANLLDTVQINGRVGALIRHATYLELLPTPLHDFKATVEWIEDSIFYHYHRPDGEPEASNDPPDQPPKLRSAVMWVLGGGAIAAAIILGVTQALRLPPWPHHPRPTQQSTVKQ